MMTQKALLLSCLVLVSPALAAPPPPTIDISRDAGGDLRFKIHDRMNGSWRMEYSPDLIDWRPQPQEVHVRNSVLPLSHYYIPAVQTSGQGYYRLAALPTPPPKTVSNTLSLPEATYGYALHATPPAILQESIGKAIINDKKATLGRVLFYDRRLSRDNSISCASCHQPERGFADGVAKSIGHQGKLTARNSISLQHARTYQKGSQIFWDGRGKSLDSAVLEPVSHPVEMGLSISDMQMKIREEPYYRELFNAAYQSSEPSAVRVSECLSDFIESMVSFRSKYDQHLPYNFANFTSRERFGKEIFTARCASCHPLGSFTSGGFANNGLDLQYADRGRRGITGLVADEAMFRIPSLRQVGLTAPYMHDGRFATLRQVIDFYDHGVKNHQNLTLPLKPVPMKLNEEEKLALEAFLNTLTDTSAQENPAFSDPFRTD